MLELYAKITRGRRRLIVVTLVMGVGLAAILAAPHDERYAAASRLVLLAAFALIIVVGFYAIARAWRRYAEDRIRLRHHGVPRPMAAALHFLLEERRMARRGMATACFSGLTALFLYLLSGWPQCALLTPARPLFADVAIISVAAIFFLPIWYRTNWINAHFVRTYLDQQARYVGFRPVTMKEAKRQVDALLGPSVQRVGKAVRAGGFLWNFEDFTKGVIVFGQPGSGKTAFVLNALLELFFAMPTDGAGPFGGLVQDVKGDFKSKIEGLCRRYGRRDDLFIFDLHADPARAGAQDCMILNVIPEDASPVEVAAIIMLCAQHLGMKSQESFFHAAAKHLIAMAIVLMRAGLPTGETPSVHHLYRLAHERPSPPAVTADGEIIDDGAASTLYEELCERIVMRWPDRTALPKDVFEAIEYFEGELKHMGERQRAGITTTLSQLVSELMSEPARAFVTGTSTKTIQEIVDEGKILYVHAVLAEYPRLALVVNTFIKMQFYYAIRRRRGKKTPSIYFCDEFHNLFLPGIEGDAQFFSLSRESNHANIIAAQNLPLLYQASKNKYEVPSLIGNCATKIFLRNSETETNKFASSLFGEMSNITLSQSEAARFGHIWRRSHTNYSLATASAPVVPPEAFSTLAVPVHGAPQPLFTEAIVHLGTRAETMRLELLWTFHPL